MTNLFGEFFGTLVLISFGCGVNANLTLAKSYANGAGWICTSAGWAFGVMIGAFTAISLGAPQADLNPAVTLFKTFAGTYTFAQAIPTMLVQILGGIAGATVTWLMFLPHWGATDSKEGKLSVFATGPAINSPMANLLSELLATAFLLIAFFTTASKAVQGNPGFGTGLNIYIIAMIIWGIGLSMGGTTGYAINPARDLGPRIAHAILPIASKGSSNWGYAWIPIVGPMLGASLAFLFCRATNLV
ncbi:MIP/aquaporin family protein [Pelosinus propionicus]|uniref:Glycerol uptake facilitator protein n=1 Tax=Pelosinus propionicus DSM 13327 TaxID=1123291 RepID=A0A1I4N870_9FIRM|nr:MIP/aquaporin family protein [Pelosinus propionicus]SFM11754.1 glycerol uptake facilitator protein [Pelosinus propionicus DSM 13327]